MSHRPAERLKIFNEVVSVSSAAGVQSNVYSLADAYKISFIVGMGTAAGSTLTDPTIAVNQHSDLAGATATQAAIAGATGSFGPSTANQIEGAQRGLISMTTASTLTDIITIGVGGNSYVMTYVGQTTSQSTIATALAFGTSAGSTGGAGMAAEIASFANIVNNSTLGYWFTATTVSTAAARLVINDSAISTGFSAITTGGGFSAAYEKSQSIIEVLAEDLNTTSEYVSLSITSADTAVQFGITVVKEGMRLQPPTQVGQHVKTT